MAEIKIKKSFGACSFDRISPPRGKLSGDTKTLNVVLSFEEALKLNLAIDEGIRKLNKYDRSTKAGRNSALNLALFLEKKRLTVTETKIRV